MAARTSHDFAYGEEPTSSDMNSLPKGRIGFLRYTTSESGISTEQALTDFAETVDVQGTNRALAFEASVNVYASTAGSDLFAEVRIREDSAASGTVVAYGQGIIRGDGTSEMQTIKATGGAINVNGSHTYYVTLAINGVATLSTGHSSTRPGFLRIVDEGPTS